MICIRFAVSADKGDISIYFVGAIRTHIPDVSGAARPRTPRFTFGRPKVNRKTAKTKVLDSFVLTSLYQIWNIFAPNQVFVI